MNSRSLAVLGLAVAAIAITRCIRDTVPTTATSGAACTLSGVIDGDSIRCADGREIRLLSIDAPEFAQAPWGERAREALLARAPLRTSLTVEYDLERRDGFGRDLAYVYLADGSMLNEHMVASGYAVTFVIPPNQRHAHRMEAAEEEAKQTGAGLWGEWGFLCRPAAFRGGRCT